MSAQTDRPGPPTGDLAQRIAEHLAELDDALVRLSAHAARGRIAGLTEADPATGEQWDAGQIWAHMAEFGSYWRRELRTIVDAPASRDPVPFGRTKRDPHRIAMIEQGRQVPISEQMAIVRRDVEAFRSDLAQLSAEDWTRRGRHETLGDMDLWTFLDHFATGHYLEHLEQLDALHGGPTDLGPHTSHAPRPTWVEVSPGSPFPLHNLPFGYARRPDGTTGAFVAIGDLALDLDSAVRSGFFRNTLARPGILGEGRSLNGLAAAGASLHSAVRRELTELFTDRGVEAQVRPSLVPARELTMLLPVEVGDYVDFYSSLHHATNLGRLFRPDGEALLPNWRHLPVGYHGRSGTIVPDHEEIPRPNGLRMIEGAPTFGPARSLDIELEVGWVVSAGTQRGEPIKVADADRHLFGLCLVNDWSARDIQSFEYQPLGPFLGKSFATSMSPWIVTLEALAPFRVEPPRQDPPVADYLRTTGPTAFDLHLEVLLQTASMRSAGAEPVVISATGFADMYWTPAQQLAHMTANGASVRPGDLFASGTVSGPTAGSEGSLIELTWNGQRRIQLPDGSTRAFLEDGDRITLRGWAGRDPMTRIGLGSVTGTIVPAKVR